MGAMFYVYEHWRPDRGECFYVGKGRGNRANVLYGRNEHHTAIQHKLSRLGLCVEVRLIATGLTEDEAFALEIERIAFWRADGADLANYTAGGEGGSDPRPETRERMRQAKLGRTLSDEHKAKIGEASRRAAQDPAYRAKLSEAIRARRASPESKAKASDSQKKRVRTKEHYAKVSAALTGRKLSPEHAEKARRASLGRKQPEDEITRRAESIKAAHATPEVKERHRAAMKAFCATPSEWVRKSAAQSKPVLCVTNGVVYTSAKEAAAATKVDRSMVTKVCKGKFPATKGFAFKYATPCGDK